MFRWTGNPPFHIIVFVCDENVCEYWMRLVGWFWCLFWMFWRLLDVWWWELISFWRWSRFLTQIPKVIFHCILVKYVNGLREVSKHKYQYTFQVPATRSGWWRMRRSSTRNLISPPQGWVPCCAFLCHHDVYTWSCSRREWCLSVHILKCPLCTVFCAQNNQSILDVHCSCWCIWWTHTSLQCWWPNTVCGLHFTTHVTQHLQQNYIHFASVPSMMLNHDWIYISIRWVSQIGNSSIYYCHIFLTHFSVSYFHRIARLHRSNYHVIFFSSYHVIGQIERWAYGRHIWRTLGTSSSSSSSSSSSPSSSSSSLFLREAILYQ